MKISVIGTGYVGLVTGTCLSDMGNNVICVDNNESKLERLINGEVPIYEPGLEVLFDRNTKEKRLTFTDDLRYAVNNSDIIFLCLPTPQDEDGSADLRHLLGAVTDIAEIMKDDNSYKILIDKSTVPVGTAGKVKEILNDFGVSNCDVASNPEFLREGYAVEDFMKPDRIVIGTDSEKALSILRKLYEPFVRQGNPILEMDTASAEVTKYAANSYLAMRITYMNQLANFCEKVGADVDLVRKGMGTDTRIGKRFLFPGIGYGGSCFPKDVNALIKTSTDSGYEISLLSVVDEVNKKQKLILVEKLLNYFDDSIEDKKIGVWGLSFKPNTDDMREAPSIYIIEKLAELGAEINAFDPAAMENSKSIIKAKVNYCENMYDASKDVDALMILTEWNEFRNPDLDKLESLMKGRVIFDGRNIYDIPTMQKSNFDYISIGRQPVLRVNKGMMIDE